MTKGKIAKPVTQKLRCAIYTRKSSEEGLEMEFNSLDAQRDACSAYIASQRSEGWLELAGHYDDGGISGRTLERPALKRLLADIEEDRVDVVVVYKIDRLSRALMDFAKLVEVFDRNDVTFVSVTQGAMMGVFNNLVMYDQSVPQSGLNSVVPDLATAWSWDETRTRLTFTLRQGVKWHDGKPFTAADVKCTWDTLLGRAPEKFRVNPRKT